MNASEPPPPTTWLPTATLASVTVAVIVGFVRVFDSPSFLVPLLLVGCAGHLSAAGTRRLGRGWPTLIMVVAGTWVTVDLTHWAVVTLGVPTPFTFDVIGHDLDAAVQTLRTASAPVPPDAGLLFAAAVTVWIMAWTSDRLSFGYAAPVEALVPSCTVFVVVTSLAGSDHRWESAALYGGAVALHLLVYRNLATSTTGGAPRSDGRWRPIAQGGAMATLALMIGLGAASTVPALAPDGLVGLRDSKTVTVVSPLVDIRSRLVDQSDADLFEVTASRPEYWRLMALDTFDGEQWSPPNSQVPESDHFLVASHSTAPSTRIQADFHLTGLGGTYAPAPYRPTYVSDLIADGDRGATPGLLWDSDYSTLIASSSTGDVNGLSYTIIADVPQVTRRLVARAHGRVPRDLERTFTRLPADFPADLTAQARRIVAGATTPFEQALALQRFFSPVNGFTYSTEVPANSEGEGTDAIRAFLDLRTGFCEQFAGTYAALARAVGLPTRIAVGFTWGRAVHEASDGSRTYLVTGRNAHAWPEVYFAGLGWLPFEPTPGRGNPAAESYTGMSAAQDDAGAHATTVPTTAAAQIPAVPTTAPAPAPPTAPSAAAPTRPSTTPPSSGPSRSSIVALLVVLALVAGPIVRVLRRRRRRRAADTPARRIRLSWSEAIHAWRPLGLERRPVDTDRDVGDRLAQRIDAILGPDGPGVQARRLAELAGAAAWNGPGVTDRQVREAAAAADRLARIARDHRSRWSRLIGWFDPRVPPRRN